MYGQQMKCIYLVLLIILPSLITEATSTNSGRRRPGLASAKATEEATERSDTIPDQIAQAASRADTNKYRRGGPYYKDNDGDARYNALDINLIRPESEAPIHTQITAKYSISHNRPEVPSSLDDAETAEEYVSKAMQIYGSRLREPIRIPSISQAEESHGGQSNTGNEYYKYVNSQQKQQQQDEQLNMEQQQKSQLAQQSVNDPKTLLQSQMQSQLEAQMQQAQRIGANQQQQQVELESQTERGQEANIQNSQPAPTIEKEPLTRSYEVYDDGEGGQQIDRHYRTRYVYQAPAVAYREQEAERQRQAEEKIRVSASTEIPKAEIMKQIEKSVIKYMKELEAEGKIIATPQEPKTYFQVVGPQQEEQRISTTTTRPKYPSPVTAYHGNFNEPNGQSAVPAYSSKQSQSPQSALPATRHHMPKLSKKNPYQSETESAYSSANLQHQEMSDALAPNVEFIYKIKTRAPLQTATVKTISKPYSLPLKTHYDQFDHSAALKNLEEFDLSHVVTTQDPDDHPSSATSKPNKLYFNSEIYHDINSLPFKPGKHHALAAEYRKVKASELPTEYKGYPGGYFAEPLSDDSEKSPAAPESSSLNDDGYPIMNPYQYVLKKEQLPNKYDEASSSGTVSSGINWENARPHNKPIYSGITAQKALEYDSYSPKFNNNPEGYGYQHTYKQERDRDSGSSGHKYASTRHTNNKRGKRGGGHINSGKKGARNSSVKDLEANLSLRPPPKV